MSKRLLQINFNFLGPRSEFEAKFLPAATPIARTPGLAWKIWLMDEANQEGGGIYLFETEDALQAFLAGPLIAGLKTDHSLSNASVKQFDMLVEHTRITRGPVRRQAFTFDQMAAAAFAAVPNLTPVEVKRRLEDEPETLVIDVRDASDIVQTGTVPGAVNLSYGSLTYLADSEVPESWRDPRLANRSRPIITTCILGPLGALGGKLLTDMGFDNVAILSGGVRAWIEAGYAVEPALN